MEPLTVYNLSRNQNSVDDHRVVGTWILSPNVDCKNILATDYDCLSVSYVWQDHSGDWWRELSAEGGGPTGHAQPTDNHHQHGLLSSGKDQSFCMHAVECLVNCFKSGFSFSISYEICIYIQAVNSVVTALRDADLNLNPIVEKNIVKVPLPKWVNPDKNWYCNKAALSSLWSSMYLFLCLSGWPRSYERVWWR